MPTAVEQGTIVYRLWGDDGRLQETESAFASVDELFVLCLEIGDPHLVDRILLSGRDESGRPRTVTFVFQSLTQPEG